MLSFSPGFLAALAMALLLPLAACGTTSDAEKPEVRSAAKAPKAVDQAPSTTAQPAAGETEVAYFAGGCFWGVEHYLEQLPGVLDVVSGYMGGHVDNPSYRQVIGKKTGHYETVKVSFDPARVSYYEVAKLFFEIHDPTQVDGQGPDIGPQYRSAVFAAGAAQDKATRELIAKLEARGLKVATEIFDAAKSTFWAAEDYHQDYYVKTGKAPYCHSRVDRFGEG